MAIKYLGDQSTGTPFETGETRTVDVTSEDLTSASGFEDDVITYTATIKDSTAAALPVTFGVRLKLNGTELASVVLDGTVYTPGTFAFVLPFTVPAAVGAFTVTLEWVDQII